MEIRTVSLVGLGALGILFGHHLASRMPRRDLRIVADRDRIARYRRDGVFCNGTPCAFHYQPDDAPCRPADLLLFAVKFPDLPDAIRTARNQVGPDTLILSLLNGIESEDMVAEAYGRDRVLDCTSQGMDAVREGSRLTYRNMGSITFGEREPGLVTERCLRVEAFFRRMEVPHQLSTDMRRQMWGKFMTNVGVNQVVAALEGDYGLIQEPGPARDRMVAAMREVLALSDREGVGLSEEDLVRWLAVLDRLDPGGKPSMRQDLEAGRKTELDLFAGTVLALGRKHGVPTPVNRDLYDRLLDMERRGLARRPAAPAVRCDPGSGSSGS